MVSGVSGMGCDGFQTAATMRDSSLQLQIVAVHCAGSKGNFPVCKSSGYHIILPWMGFRSVKVRWQCWQAETAPSGPHPSGPVLLSRDSSG